MAAAWMKTRQTKYGAYLAIYVVVILLVIGAANWLASNHNKTFDVTANKRFTLSDQTKKVLGNLKQDVQVYYFDTSGNFDRGRDLFDRYKNLSSKVHFNYVDPVKQPDVARAEGARNLGDVVVDSGTKKETAKAITEEELTGAIIRSIKTGTRTVCFVTGSGEHSLTDTAAEGYAAVKSALERNNFKTDTINLIQKPDVPKECNIVVVGGPKNDYIQPAADALKKHVESGGGLLVNFDPFLNLPENKMGDTPVLAALVANWGVTAKGDVVVDESGVSRILGPFAPVAYSWGSHPIVRVMNDTTTVFRLTRSLEVRSPAEQLFSTSETSRALTNPKLPIPESALENGAKGPFVIGAAATVGSGNNAGHLVVVGSSGWLGNQMFGQPAFSNRDLFLNMANWMTADADLISILPKDPEDRRLRITASSLVSLFWISVVVFPLIVIAAGTASWWKRR